VTKLRKRANFPTVVDEVFGQSSHAGFEVPAVFDQYTMYVVSVSDASILVDCALRTVDGFPRSLATISSRFGGLTGSEIFTLKMFVVDVPFRGETPALFFAKKDHIEFAPEPIFERDGRPPLENPEFAAYCVRKEISELQSRGELFEDYLHNMVLVKVIKKWLRMIESFEFHVFLPVAYEMAAGVRSANIDAAFRKMPSPFPHSRRLWREQFFALAEANFSALARDQTKNLNELVRTWGSWAKEFEKSINMPTLFSRPGAVNIFCRCIDRLRLTSSQGVSLSFTIVTKVARVLELMARQEKHPTLGLFTIAVVMSQSQAFPTFYLIMAHEVVNSECFEKLCSQRELASWLVFQQMMLSILSVHTFFAELFLKIRETLTRLDVKTDQDRPCESQKSERPTTSCSLK
jgi:hypothetical protein